MAAVLVVDETIPVGQSVVVEGQAENPRYEVVFEYDGWTGHLEGLDFSQQEQPIVDARHIYNVEQTTDRSTLLVVQIAFSADGLKAALVINQSPHVVIDFSGSRAYCRPGFPPPSDKWSAHDAALELFR